MSCNRNGELIKCYKCGSTNMEDVQPNQFACKDCRTIFVGSDISSEEMIEWFCD